MLCKIHRMPGACWQALCLLFDTLAACHGMQPNTGAAVEMCRRSLPFDLAAKVCVSWGVDGIQGVFAVLKRGVLGVYGNAPLLFQSIAIHEALLG